MRGRWNPVQDKYLAKVRIRESWRGRRSENRMWSNEILEEDERKGRWNSVRDKNRPRFGSDFTSATQISSTLPPQDWVQFFFDILHNFPSNGLLTFSELSTVIWERVALDPRQVRQLHSWEWLGLDTGHSAVQLIAVHALLSFFCRDICKIKWLV